MVNNTRGYTENGIILSETQLYVGDEVSITYDGLLSNCGADKVYAYIGYGDEWEEKGFIPMTYEFDVFRATFKVLLPGSLNLAFKDSAENWDNNSGQNYRFKVNRRQKTEEKVLKAGKKTAAATKTGASRKKREEASLKNLKKS